MKVGVLALQGAFRAHIAALATLGVEADEVRTPSQLDSVEAIVMPGGESTTMAKLLETSGLESPLRTRLDAGMPVLGTCAGMILLAREVLDGGAGQVTLATMDLVVRRNAFGRQIDSFESDLVVEGLATPFHAVFIRAPFVESAGPAATVLASVDGHPVLCRQGTAMAAAFHPELTADLRIHEMFLEMT